MVFCAVPSPHSRYASSSDIGTVPALTPSLRLIASHTCRIEFSPFSAK
ncbi:hypothetical protein [Bradyrhizobium sp.]|jgi:hypothetical protein|nr:hypothetical protein [Bradyrhizobium sp.]